MGDERRYSWYPAFESLPLRGRRSRYRKRSPECSVLDRLGKRPTSMWHLPILQESWSVPLFGGMVPPHLDLSAFVAAASFLLIYRRDSCV